MVQIWMHSVYLLLCLHAPLQPYSDSHRDIEKQAARLKGGRKYGLRKPRGKREEALAARRKGEKKLFQGGPPWCTISMLLY
jgi:hypothetical protein